MDLVLAGDIGGTNCRLQLFSIPHEHIEEESVPPLCILRPSPARFTVAHHRNGFPHSLLLSTSCLMLDARSALPPCIWVASHRGGGR